MLEALIIIYSVIAIVVFFILDVPPIETGDAVCSPKDFYDYGFNWFGSIVLFTLYMLFNPIGLCWRTFYWLGKLFMWLFTIGRDKK